MAKSEIICDCEIHPAASVFPLMEGQRFQSLVDSIAVHGVQNPIVCSGNVVLDGRNRLRAVEKLRTEGRDIELPAIQWASPNGMTETEWISAQNLDRRHLSEDAYVAAQAALNRILRKEAKERQAAGKFDKAKASAAANARHAARTKSTEPQKRDTKAEDARSTVGQVAAKAGTSMHKARQAVQLDKAVEAGVLPESVQKDVIAGKTKLRDAVKQVPSKPNPSKKPFKKRQRAASAVLDDLRLLLNELLESDAISRKQIVDELTTWIERANNR